MTIFLPYYVAAFALLFCEYRGSTLAGIRLPVPRWAAGVWVGGIAALYALQLGLIWVATQTIVHPEPWRATLPIPVAAHGIAHPDLVEGALLALAAAQTYALIALYRLGVPQKLVVAGFGALLALSLAAPAFVSPDPYAYAGDSILGRAAWDPPAGELPGEYAVVNRLFSTPLLPAPYGPLWISIAHAMLSPIPAFVGKLLALRVFGAVCSIALVVMLRACGLPDRIVAVAALNPALAQQYVADAHNDLLGIVLLVAAAVAVRVRRPFGAAMLVALAGLVKLPLVIFGLPVFATAGSRAARYACAALGIGLAAAISWFAAGSPYLRGLAVHVPAPGPVYVLNLAIALLGALLIAVAWLDGRRMRAGVWILPMMSSYVATWYMAYGLPYALARHRIVAYLLIALPLACALVDAKFMRPWTYAVVLPLVALFAIVRSERDA